MGWMHLRPVRPGEHPYYACRGRVGQIHMGGGERCTLPYVRADKLEWAVWKKVKAVLNNPNKLVECVEKALSELEARKSQVGAETLAVDDRLQAIRAKEERLGMAFADGAIKESVYKSRLAQLKKQEAALSKRRGGRDFREGLHPLFSKSSLFPHQGEGDTGDRVTKKSIGGG